MVSDRLSHPPLAEPPALPVTHAELAALLLREADAVQWHVPHFRAQNADAPKMARVAELRRVAAAVAAGLVVPDAPAAVVACPDATGDQRPRAEAARAGHLDRLRIHLNALALTFPAPTSGVTPPNAGAEGPGPREVSRRVAGVPRG